MSELVGHSKWNKFLQNWNSKLINLTRSIYDISFKNRKCIQYHKPIPDSLFDYLNLGLDYSYSMSHTLYESYMTNLEKASQDLSDYSSTMEMYTKFILFSFENCSRPNHLKTQNRKILKTEKIINKIRLTVKRWKQ